LLFTLIGVSGLYFYLGMEFLGAAQLIVYVGGTLVLLVFGVMLTAQNPSNPVRVRGKEWLLPSLAGIALFAMLVSISLRFGETVQVPEQPQGMIPSVGTIGMSFLNIAETSPDVPLHGYPPEFYNAPRKQNGYLLPFEILSVHLLVVLIGAAYLARAKRAARKEPLP
jgi:NADH-quinone oxidoreductase subunit J